jgi:hypothetical protein
VRTGEQRAMEASSRASNGSATAKEGALQRTAELAEALGKGVLGVVVALALALAVALGAPVLVASELQADTSAASKIRPRARRNALRSPAPS